MIPRLILFVFLIGAGSAFSKPLVKHHPKRSGDWALSKIAALPEVKSFMRFARSSNPKLMIAAYPKRGYRFYWVKVGLKNSGMFRTATNYYVDASTGKIYLWDVMNDDNPFKIVALDKFRSDPRYAKSHKFVNGKLVPTEH